MASKWQRWGVQLVVWFVSPTSAFAAVTTAAALIGAALSGQPPVVIGLFGLVALALALVVAHLAISAYGRLGLRRPPAELKKEIVSIQRELVRLSNRRETNGGSIWPIERPYRDLPTGQWDAFGSKLRLKGADKAALQTAYDLAGQFNNEMLAGETTIASEVEPDLDGLRQAFDTAAAALDLPPSPVLRAGTSRSGISVAFKLGESAELAADTPSLADQIDSLMHEGMTLVDELSVPVEPNQKPNGVWEVSGGAAPPEWQEKASAFRERAWELLKQGRPALLMDYRALSANVR